MAVTYRQLMLLIVQLIVTKNISPSLAVSKVSRRYNVKFEDLWCLLPEEYTKGNRININ
ncbi:hypothetical protein SAMN06265827_11070 [Orenia metallireducens]|uniref:Transposase n=1 Tax=Orenia metallireducens TaxID=1413210 RepID=A0A285GUG8_9FIRM|nr:hypothetical protein [Orenia metallireducens]SNY26904.1 hypothetical protein SAMN06265827_11070 [Orenia metallireducens]